MENIMNKPVIGVVMCRNRLKGHETQTLQEKYLNAIINAGAYPLPYRMRWQNQSCLPPCCQPWTGFTCRAAQVTCSRTFMVKTAMSLTPIPGVIF